MNASEDWEEIEKGRVGILRLRGPNGSLDIVMCYLDTESAMARQRAMRKLAARLNAAEKVLTVMIGTSISWNMHKTDGTRRMVSGQGTRMLKTRDAFRRP